MRIALSALAALLPALPAAAAPIELQPSGYVQAAGVLLDQSSVDELDPASGAPLNDERFVVRRARLGVVGRAGPARAEVELDGNTVDGPTVGLTRALIAAGTAPGEGDAWPLIEARLGLMPTPFGAELQRGSRHRAWLERSAAAGALVPGTHDLGVEVRGQWRFVRYQVALLDGAPIGLAERPGQDPTAADDITGRLGVALRFGEAAVDLGGSLLLGTGFSPGVPATKDRVQWQDANQNGVVELSELQPVAGLAGRPSETFDRSALGLDAAAELDTGGWGRLRVFGELYWAVNLDRAFVPADPVALGRDQRGLGLVGGVSQTLFDVGRIGLRIDHYDPDADAHERIAAALVPQDRSVTTLSGVLAFVGWDPLTVSVQYDHERNLLGRGADGAPARLENDRLILWAQVAP